jgi:hypothetical protein
LHSNFSFFFFFSFLCLQSQRGEPIIIVGSPYGLLSPASFLNYLLHGNISNFGKSRSLILVYVQSVPGTEGGAVLDSEGRLIGVHLSLLSLVFFSLSLLFLTAIQMLAPPITYDACCPPKGIHSSSKLPPLEYTDTVQPRFRKSG